MRPGKPFEQCGYASRKRKNGLSLDGDVLSQTGLGTRGGLREVNPKAARRPGSYPRPGGRPCG